MSRNEICTDINHVRDLENSVRILSRLRYFKPLCQKVMMNGCKDDSSVAWAMPTCQQVKVTCASLVKVLVSIEQNEQTAS